METLVYQRKVSNISKEKTKFCMSLHYNHNNDIYLFVNEKWIHKIKADCKNANFPTQFCLRSISNKFDYIELRNVSLK